MRTIFTFLSVLFLSLSVSAQTELNLDSKISFSAEEYDFGEKPVGTPISHKFEFTNIGNKPLVLASVKASCGCTSPSWSKEPVMPGQKGMVEAQYNMAREGKFRKSVTVKTGDGETITLYISGEAIHKKSVEEAKPSFFGR